MEWEIVDPTAAKLGRLHDLHGRIPLAITLSVDEDASLHAHASTSVVDLVESAAAAHGIVLRRIEKEEADERSTD